MGGLIIHDGLIYEFTVYKHHVSIQELRAEERGGLIIHQGLIIHTIRYMYILDIVHVRLLSLASPVEHSLYLLKRYVV